MASPATHIWTMYWAYPGAVPFTVIAVSAIVYTLVTHAMYIRGTRRAP